jgi:hypothetical protein
VDRTALFVVAGLALTACTGSPTVDDSETKKPASHDAVAFGAGRFEEDSGLAHVDIPEPAFWGKADHELMPVIADVQNTISAVKSV